MNIARSMQLIGAGFLLSPLVFSQRPTPPAGEDEDHVRERAEWFYEHRRDASGEVGFAARAEATRQVDRMLSTRKRERSAEGPRWVSIGPRPISTQSGNFILGGRVNLGGPFTAGRISALAVDPRNQDVAYLGGAFGGVWKTTDGGKNWVPLTDDAPSLAIGALALDPANPDIVYAGTGEQTFSGSSYYGAGILKSTDGGATWSHIPGTFVGPFPPLFDFTRGGARIGAIAVHYRDSRILLAAVYTGIAGTSGIYRSADAGETWQTVMIGAAGNQVLFDPVNADIAYASMGLAGAANGIFRSTDAGRTWTPVHGPLPAVLAHRIEIALAPSAPNVLYANLVRADNSSFSFGTFRSDNSGQTWTQLAAPDYCSPQCFYNNVLTVHPRNPNIVTAGGVNLWRSVDGGRTWADISLSANGVGVHVDHHAQAFSADGTRFYSGNDGGVWSTPVNNAFVPTWTNLNSTLVLTQFYPGFSIHPDTPDITFGGTQDNGYLRYSADRGWEYATCGDGGFGAIDFALPENLFATCQNLAILKQQSQGNLRAWYVSHNGISGDHRVAFIPPFVMDPNNPVRLYFGAQRLYVSNDSGGQWTAISEDLALPNGTIRSIAVAPGDPRMVWVGTSQGFVHVSTNADALGSVQWTDRRRGLPSRVVTQIALDPLDPKTAYVSFAGFRGVAGQPDGSVFKTSDQGETWVNVTANLPNTPVNDVFLDPDLPGTLYAATDVGVFRSSDSGGAWEPLMDGLPRVVVMALKMHRPTRTLRAATHGRGMWDLSLPLAGPSRAPRIRSISPETINRRSGAFPLTVRGANFTEMSVVRWNGLARPTRLVSATELVAAIEAGDILEAGRATISVISASAGGGLSNAVHFPVGPAPALAAASDIASPTTRLVPGSVASVFGRNLAPETGVAEPSVYSLGGGLIGYPLPLSLANVTVELNGDPAPIQFVSPEQINFQVPWYFSAYRGADLVVTNGTWQSRPVPVAFGRYAPSLFSISGNGRGQGVIQIAGERVFAAPAGSIAGARPARRGEMVEILGSGFGNVSIRPADGAPSPATLSWSALPTFTIGDKPALASSAHLVPGLIGVYQANVEIPAEAPSGPAVPVFAALDGERSNTVTMAIE